MKKSELLARIEKLEKENLRNKIVFIVVIGLILISSISNQLNLFNFFENPEIIPKTQINQDSFEFKGRVVDTTNTPVVNAVISVNKKKDTTSINGVFYFKLKYDDQFALIEIKKTGYKPKVFSIIVEKNQIINRDIILPP